MELNQIFYQDKYSEAYDIAIVNNWTIKEIEPDEKGRRFQLIENKLTEKEILIDEMQALKSWLDTYYTQHEQKYRRLHTLGQKCDNGADPYNELVKLYEEAETKRKRIQEIEELIK